MGRDANTPEWVQHIAFKVDSVATLEAVKARLEANGIPVVGITDHTIFKSIYFFDPNGHRLELAADTATPDMNAGWTPSSGRCWTSGRRPGARPGTRPGCTKSSSRAPSGRRRVRAERLVAGRASPPPATPAAPCR